MCKNKYISISKIQTTALSMSYYYSLFLIGVDLKIQKNIEMNHFVYFVVV